MYFTLIFFIILILPLLAMPKYILTGVFSPHRVVVQATITVTSAMVLIFMIASVSGQGLYAQSQEITKMIAQQAAETAQLNELLGISDLSNEEQVAAYNNLYDRGLMQMPVSLMFLGAIVAYLEYIIISKLLSKRAQVKLMPKFRELSFPQGTAMAIMLMYILAWAIYSADVSFGEMLYLNINLLFDIVFALQGISVVLMMFHLKRLPKAVGVVVVVIMWLTAIGKMLLVLIGIADLILGLKVRMHGRGAGKS